MSRKSIQAKLQEITTRLDLLERRPYRRPRLRAFGSLTEAQDKLLNARLLAAAMNVSASFILAMKRAGYRFTNGHQTTLESALAWRAAHPQFRTRFYLQKGWRHTPKLRAVRCAPEPEPILETTPEPESHPAPITEASATPDAAPVPAPAVTHESYAPPTLTTTA